MYILVVARPNKGAPISRRPHCNSMRAPTCVPTRGSYCILGICIGVRRKMPCQFSSFCPLSWLFWRHMQRLFLLPNSSRAQPLATSYPWPVILSQASSPSAHGILSQPRTRTIAGELRGLAATSSPHKISRHCGVALHPTPRSTPSFHVRVRREPAHARPSSGASLFFNPRSRPVTVSLFAF